MTYTRSVQIKLETVSPVLQPEPRDFREQTEVFLTSAGPGAVEIAKDR
jgi:hypothetical protein